MSFFKAKFFWEIRFLDNAPPLTFILIMGVCDGAISILKWSKILVNIMGLQMPLALDLVRLSRMCTV